MSMKKKILLLIFLALLQTYFFILGGVSDRLFTLQPVDYLTNYFKDETGNTISKTLNITLNDEIADISEKASESVVTVSIKSTRRLSGLSLEELLFGIDLNEGSLRNIEQDIGTGFVVDDFVVTNRHVVSDTTAEYTIFDKEDNEYVVENIYRDPNLDLAILKVTDLNLPSFELGDSSNIRVGETVIAIGTALGEFRHTVTTGVISGLGRGIVAGSYNDREQLDNLIQTDAAINPGNSGGPLLDRLGRVIGVNVAISANAQNIGFAIPIKMVKASIDNFNETGRFDRPFLGVSYRTISIRGALLNEVPAGAYVQEVVPGSAADDAGIRPGDIIVSLNGTKIGAENSNLGVLINEYKIGDVLKLAVYKVSQDEIIDIEVTLKGNNSN
jgi:serine protease Do